MAKVQNRFVILSAARSGSTAFTTTLGAHPKVYCHGSPFFSSPRWKSALHKEAEDVVDLGKRETDPVGLVYDILNFTPGPPNVGCKLWHNADKGPTAAIEALAADETIKKVILNRENLLAAHSSGVVMQMRRQQPELFEDPEAKPKLTFDKVAFLRFANRRMQWFEDYRTMSKGNVIEIPYINLMTDGIDAMRPFLKLHPYRLRQRTKKVGSGDIIGRYDAEYHPEIRAALDELGRPEWEREDHRTD